LLSTPQRRRGQEGGQPEAGRPLLDQGRHAVLGDRPLITGRVGGDQDAGQQEATARRGSAADAQAPGSIGSGVGPSGGSNAQDRENAEGIGDSPGSGPGSANGGRYPVTDEARWKLDEGTVQRTFLPRTDDQP